MTEQKQMAKTTMQVTVQKVKAATCLSPYHRHESRVRGGEFDECVEGGEHIFDGAAHRLVGQRMPYYDCVKCGKAAVVLYKCTGRGQ
ncbi:MAG: hypothetical protein JRN68_09595 [Nitrososphaerota archaeon]|nr:hypothetical protein [Ferrimicrobium acidiphilum]MDG6934934.1 hypothetical protein [Nitrososphaerota archaeon]